MADYIPPQNPNYAHVEQASPEALKNVQEWLNQQAELQRRKEELERQIQQASVKRTPPTSQGQ